MIYLVLDIGLGVVYLMFFDLSFFFYEKDTIVFIREVEEMSWIVWYRDEK